MQLVGDPAGDLFLSSLRPCSFCRHERISFILLVIFLAPFAAVEVICTALRFEWVALRTCAAGVPQMGVMRRHGASVFPCYLGGGHERCEGIQIVDASTFSSKFV